MGNTETIEMAAVVWLHGLGDTGAGWQGAFPLQGNVKFIHPNAPTAPVSIQGGAPTTSWFDLHTWPVGLDEPECPEGLTESIAAIHKVLDKVCATTDSKKVLLGGFSQGAAMTLAAGLTYDKPLGGLVSISGWTHKRGANIPVNDANRSTPVFFTCGKSDPVIDFKYAKQSGSELKEVLGPHVDVNLEPRSMHQPTGGEMEQALEFMQGCIK